ncbi:MAG: hypothetical protein HKO01_09560 [Flaviramulus sp.]|nr:hypothetical protein [Flaviramulus sp.]NNC50768.1 hypothetical protein [Flaviramulus sp.]
MKTYHLFILLITSFFINAQSNCDDANSYLVNAYSHVKDAYDSNNISHLKYYANRSLESFKLSKKTLTTCGCETALKLANKSFELLAKVEDVETYEDGRFYVKRARDISKECVIEIDKCASKSNNLSSENTELSDLQNEQLLLHQQQEALKLKEAQLKTKMALQKIEVLNLKKKELILSYKKAISSNIKSYNEALKVCDCNHEFIKDESGSQDYSDRDFSDIKNHYNNNIRILASNYLDQLSLCAN